MTIRNNTIIIDYGMGNLDSVQRALEECGATVKISNNVNEIRNATHLILPGVGAFKAGMDNLCTSGLTELISEQVKIKKVPFLGICLGMQLLADKGFEGGESPGLGFVSGEVRLLKSQKVGERIPHVGWDQVSYLKESVLFKNISENSDFYFVHSYHFVCSEQQNVIGVTKYADGFVSAVQNENIFGVQFHPEKSQKMGFQVFKNFLSY